MADSRYRSGNYSGARATRWQTRARKALIATIGACACLGAVATAALADQTISYQVQAGDTAFSLARQFGTTVGSIAAANSLTDANVLAAGQVLQITVPGSPAAPLGNVFTPSPANSDVATNLTEADLLRLTDVLAYDPDPIQLAPAAPTAPTISTAPPASTAPTTSTSPANVVAPANSIVPTSSIASTVSEPVSIPKTVLSSTSAPVAKPTPAPAPALPVAPIVAPVLATTSAPAIPAVQPPAPTPAPAPAPLPGPPILSAPYYRQFDGSIYAESNCGPTSLSMAIGALGVNIDQITLRHEADKEMGRDAGPDNGTTWESLAYAAKVNGVSADGLYSGTHYRVWSINDIKTELAKGRPVIMLVRYWDLPDHVDSAYGGDHYIVALGFDGDGNLIYNDPAFKVGSGADRVISLSQLNRAWTSTAIGQVRTAMALVK